MTHLSVVFLFLVICNFIVGIDSVKVYCQKFFHDKVCTQTSFSRCQIADPSTVQCWPLVTPQGYLCNSSGVFQMNFKSGCDQISSVEPIPLNSQLGFCESTTFSLANGDNFYMHTCPDVASTNLILLYNYATFPNTYNAPNCTQPDSLNLIPDAFDDGACYVNSLTPPSSYSVKCSGGQVTKTTFSSVNCAAATAGPPTQYTAGECYSVSTSAPYSTGFTYRCGLPTRAPTRAPTTGFPTPPTISPAPTNAALPTVAPAVKRWSAQELSADFNANKYARLGVSSYLNNQVFVSVIADSTVSGSTISFSSSFMPAVNDAQKTQTCDAIKSTFDTNYDRCTNYYSFSCSFSTKKRFDESEEQTNNTAVFSLSDTGAPGPGGIPAPGGSGGISGRTIGIIVGVVLGVIILLVIIGGVLYYFNVRKNNSSFEDNYRQY